MISAETLYLQIFIITASVVKWVECLHFMWKKIMGHSPSADNKIGIYSLYAKHAALRSKSKAYMAWNWNKESKLSYMSTSGLSFQ